MSIIIVCNTFRIVCNTSPKRLESFCNSLGVTKLLVVIGLNILVKIVVWVCLFFITSCIVFWSVNFQTFYLMNRTDYMANDTLFFWVAFATEMQLILCVHWWKIYIKNRVQEKSLWKKYSFVLLLKSMALK